MQMRTDELTSDERAAIRDFRLQQGRQWRCCLEQMYLDGTREPKDYWGTMTKAVTIKAMIDRLGGTDVIKRLPLV